MTKMLALILLAQFVPMASSAKDKQRVEMAVGKGHVFI